MSRTFAIIGCSATKKEGIAPAGELYCSDLFNKKKQWTSLMPAVALTDQDQIKRRMPV